MWYRFLLAILALSSLTAFQVQEAFDAAELEKPPIVTDAQSHTATVKPLQNHKTTTNTTKQSSNIKPANKTSLVLSVPFSVDLPKPLALQPQNQSWFTPSAKPKPTIDVGGAVLLTPEQETEKRKAIDGAGISIHINR